MYLPLEIKKSSIMGAGLGVFATELLHSSRIVCSYLGEIGTGRCLPALRKYANDKIDKLNDSFFTLGWIER